MSAVPVRTAVAAVLYPAQWAVLQPVAQTLVFLAAFTYWPIARSLIYGFFDVQLGSTEIFYVGWENYQRLWHDALFWQSLRNTVVYMVVTVPTSIGLALVLAVALDRKLRGTSLYRSVFFYPVMVPSVAAGMVWVFLYAPGYGPINGLMELLGLPKLDVKVDGIDQERRRRVVDTANRPRRSGHVLADIHGFSIRRPRRSTKSCLPQVTTRRNPEGWKAPHPRESRSLGTASCRKPATWPQPEDA